MHNYWQPSATDAAEGKTFERVNERSVLDTVEGGRAEKREKKMTGVRE